MVRLAPVLGLIIAVVASVVCFLATETSEGESSFEELLNLRITDAREPGPGATPRALVNERSSIKDAVENASSSSRELPPQAAVKGKKPKKPSSESAAKAAPPLQNESKMHPAWVCVGALDSKSLYHPITYTLREAFKVYNWELQTVHWSEMYKVLKSVRDSIHIHNVTPVIVAFAWFRHWWGRFRFIRQVRMLSKLGAYVVVYNTEPATRYWNRTVPVAREVNAKEIWDYSRAIQSLYAEDYPEIPKRHMPPGCAKELDFGVDLDAPAVDGKHVSFLGAWSERVEEEREAYNSSLNGMILPHCLVSNSNCSSVTSAQEWRAFLEEFPLQLNLHAWWNVKPAFECFRAAMMVINKACFLSEPAHHLDQDVWSGVAHFLSHEEMHSFYEHLQSDENALRECRQRSYDNFCKNFQPVDILQRSGFLDVLLQLTSHAVLA